MSNMKTVSLVDHEVRALRADTDAHMRDLQELYERLADDVASLNAAIDQVRAAVEKLRAKP
jgi:uncharacterized protein YoxC